MTHMETNISRFKGSGVEVVVGVENVASIPQGTWSLPRALISHHSLSLREACDRDRNGNAHEFRVTLPEDDQVIFELFVEWMYYSYYTLTSSHLRSHNPTVNADAQAWVLGDRLRSTEFKNYAMVRLHAQYIKDKPPRAITTADVRYVAAYSQEESALRMLYHDLLAVHFTNVTRIHGSVDEWDELLLTHATERKIILKSLRGVLHTFSAIGSLQKYLVSADDAGLMEDGKTVHAKRDADGSPVKQELVDN
jgi:hypothetical protein